MSSEEFRDIATKSATLKEMLDRIGLGYRGHSYDTLKERLREEGIDFTSVQGNKKNSRYVNIHEVLIENSPYVSTNSLKHRLLKEGILENKCSVCGQLPIHMDKPLSLQLDHINGIHNDHRVINLRIICPQCHSQTITYSGKNSNNNEYRISYFKKHENEIIKVEDGKLIISIGNIRMSHLEFVELLDNKVADEICRENSISIGDLKKICSRLKLKIRYKNRTKKIIITKDELSELITKLPKEKIGKMFGVSGKAIGKKCVALGIKMENMRGYWAKQRSCK